MAINDLDRLARFLHLMGNPVRLKIMFLLVDHPRCVCELSSELNHLQPCISQHLTLLRQEGLVSSQRDGWNQYYFISSKNIGNYLQCLLKNWKDQYETVGPFDVSKND